MESGSGLMWTSVTCFVSCTRNLALLKAAAKLPLIFKRFEFHPKYVNLHYFFPIVFPMTFVM